MRRERLAFQFYPVILSPRSFSSNRDGPRAGSITVLGIGKVGFVASMKLEAPARIHHNPRRANDLSISAWSC